MNDYTDRKIKKRENFDAESKIESITKTVSLLNSMIMSGEEHTETSIRYLEDCFNELNKLDEFFK